MLLSCFFIRKKIILFVLNKIFYKFISSMFFVDLNYSFWSSFLYFSYVECIHALPYIHHAPWPREFLFCSKGFVLSSKGFFLSLRGFFLSSKGFFLSSWAIWLSGKLFKIYISLSRLSYQHYCLASKSHRSVF